MRKCVWRSGLAALGLMAFFAAPACAIIVYGDPGRLTTMPTLSGDVKPGWQFIGTFKGYSGIPIGPRAWVTATHVSDPTGTLNYDNAGTSGTISYASTRAGTSGDLAVYLLNENQPSFTEWAPVWQSTTTLDARIQAQTLDVYMYGRGAARGAAILNDSSQTVGWNWTGWTQSEPLSYGTGNVFQITSDGSNDYLQMPFFPAASTSGIFSPGDSGGAIFALNNDTARWELIGINYAVDTVYAAPTTNLSNYRQAAFFDARGQYYYQLEGNPPAPVWYQIEGAGPVALSSYSTALPQKYGFLAPFIAVPEPSTWILAGLSAGGMILAVRRRRLAAN